MTQGEQVDKVIRPGDRVRELLEERGWTQADLATILGGDPKAPNEIIRGRRSITPKTAQGLAAAFGTTTAKYWLDLEAAYQLTQIDHNGEGIAKKARIFEKAPIREMVKRGWIAETSDPEELERRILSFFDVGHLDEEPRFARHSARKSTSYGDVTPAQWAWLFRARQLAEAVQATNFTEARLQAALEEIRQLLLSPSEIYRIPAILANCGVRLIIVEALPGTRIDGACFWLNARSPVVALSMRFDRIDYFWHTLMHELGHVSAGDGRGDDLCPLDIGFGDDEEQPPDKPESERAADSFASSFLVDREELRDFIVRVSPLYSPSRIMGFSKRIKVHPGIVIGQLQFLGELSYRQYRTLLTKAREVVTKSALTDGWGFAPVLTRPSEAGA